MQFMVYLARNIGDQPSPPSPEGMAEMMKVMEEAMSSGMVVATGQLGPDSTRLQLTAGEVSVSDGPFIEGKELVPGFTIVRVDSKQQAIDWAAKLRRCMGDGEIRIAEVLMPGMEDE